MAQRSSRSRIQSRGGVGQDRLGSRQHRLGWRQVSVLCVAGVGAVGVVVSLFMPWQRVGCGTRVSGVFEGSDPSVGLRSLLSCGAFGRLDGWSSAGDFAGLSAVVFVVMVMVAVARPGVGARLPFSAAAVFVGYFTLAAAFVASSQGAQENRLLHVVKAGVARYRYAYGTYVALVAAGVVVLGGLVFVAGSMRGRPGFRRLMACIPACVLLGVLLLPWQRPRAGLPSYNPLGVASQLGVAADTGLVAGALALLLFRGLLTRRDGFGFGELTLALGSLVFAAATLGLLRA